MYDEIQFFDESHSLDVEATKEQLLKLFAQVNDRVKEQKVGRERRLRSRTTDWQVYLLRHWSNRAVLWVNRKAVVERLERELHSTKQVPSLYGILGLYHRRGVPPWPVPIELDDFKNAVTDSISETRSNKFTRLKTVLEGSDLIRRWDHYKPWQQVECLGYTEWGKRAILFIQSRYKLEEFRIRNSDANKVAQALCVCIDFVHDFSQPANIFLIVEQPTLENYHRILEWQGDPTCFLKIIESHRPPVSTVGLSKYNPVTRPTGVAQAVHKNWNIFSDSSAHSRDHLRPIPLSWQELETPETYHENQSPSSTAYPSSESDVDKGGSNKDPVEWDSWLH